MLRLEGGLALCCFSIATDLGGVRVVGSGYHPCSIVSCVCTYRYRGGESGMKTFMTLLFSTLVFVGWRLVHYGNSLSRCYGMREHIVIENGARRGRYLKTQAGE